MLTVPGAALSRSRIQSRCSGRKWSMRTGVSSRTGHFSICFNSIQPSVKFRSGVPGHAGFSTDTACIPWAVSSSRIRFLMFCSGATASSMCLPPHHQLQLMPEAQDVPAGASSPATFLGVVAGVPHQLSDFDERKAGPEIAVRLPAGADVRGSRLRPFRSHRSWVRSRDPPPRERGRGSRSPSTP